MGARAAVGQLGVLPEAGLTEQAKLVDIIICKCQSFILRYTMSINEACPSVSTIPIPLLSG